MFIAKKLINPQINFEKINDENLNKIKQQKILGKDINVTLEDSSS
jgi:hypothetical protein